MHTETCNLACTEPLIDPHRTPKTKVQSDLLYGSKSPAEKTWACIGIFQLDGLHSSWDACFRIVVVLLRPKKTTNGDYDFAETDQMSETV